MKNIFCIILLFIFLFNIGGYFVVFKIKQNQIYSNVKSEIKTALKKSVPDDELHLFYLSIDTDLPKDAFWVKPGKEFKLGNNLYDVVRIENQMGRKVLLCINDIQEEALFEHLNDHIERNIANASKNKSKNTKIEKKAQTLYDLPTNIIFIIKADILKYVSFNSHFFHFFQFKYFVPPRY